MRWRRQPPAYSPIPVAALAAACSAGDTRPALSNDLARIYGASRAELTGSGTIALTLALRIAADRRPGSVCVLPAYGCYDLATAVVGADVRVRLYDIDPYTLAPDQASLHRALADGAAALVAVHFFGIPAPLERLREAARKAGALLIEDAAQGAGGLWRGEPLGSHGDVGILSFGRGKGITGGGGGALLLKDASLALPSDAWPLEASGGLRSLHAAKLAVQWALGRPSLYRLPTAVPGLGLGETVYRAPGSCVGMAPACARVLHHTLRRAEAESIVRGEVARRLRNTARSGKAVDFEPVGFPAGDSRAGWLRLPWLAQRDAADIARRFSHLGVQQVYPLPLNALPALAGRIEGDGPWPGASRLARHLVTFPTHSLLTPRDIRLLEDLLEGRTDTQS